MVIIPILLKFTILKVLIEIARGGNNMKLGKRNLQYKFNIVVLVLKRIFELYLEAVLQYRDS